MTMIRPKIMNGEVINHGVVQEALDAFAKEFGLSAKAAHQRCLEHAGDRSTEGWVAGIQHATSQLRMAGQMPAPVLGQSWLASEMDAYAAKHPGVDAAGNRLCLTASNGSRPQPDATAVAAAAAEANRIALTNHQPNGRMKFDLQRVAASSMTPASVALSEARLYDDSSELLLLTETTSADVDAELLRLATQDKMAKYLNLAQGGPSRTDTIDAGLPAVSDLVQQTLPPNQGYTGAVFSDRAMAEFNALPDEEAQLTQAELNAAGRASGPHQAAGHLLRAMRAACQTKHLKHELSLRAHAAVDAAVSGIPSTADATTQSAAGYKVQDEVDRLSKSASAPARGNTTGNLSTAPKSQAQRTAETRAARPGYSNDPARGGFGF